jgi:AraC-like DNA-binding protein
MANVLLLASGGIAGYYGMKQDTLLFQVASLERARPLSAPVQEMVLQKEELQGYPVQSRPIPLIPVEEARKIVKGLDNLMLTKKPFLDTRYSLSDLCLQLNTSRRVMTYVLNDVMGKNFYGVVNEYRMKEAIQIMENSGKKYTIEAIAEMVGFNSKSSFYACFKKYTGSSPKEYFENK